MTMHSFVLRSATFFILITNFIYPVFADSGRIDFDVDDDGLIEINDLADLDEIRNNLDGKTLYGVSTGCPAEGCTGFELTQSLDFDTNADGVMDSQDTYWNSGAGWVPIGWVSTEFSSTFEGNGYEISNLYINTNYGGTGLFGFANGAILRNLGLGGPLMQINISGGNSVGGLVGYLINSSVINCDTTGSVTGGGDAGGLVGSMENSSLTDSYSSGVVAGEGAGGLVGLMDNSSIVRSFATGPVSGVGISNNGGLIGFMDGSSLDACFATGAVISENTSGGLVGRMNNSSVTTCFATGAVSGTVYAGGVAGYSDYQSKITASFASGAVSGAPEQGGLAGYIEINPGVFDSFWAIDSTGQNSSDSSANNAGIGDTLAHLQCPTTADDSNCSTNALYTGWSSYSYTNGTGDTIAYWDFGTSTQLPGLSLNGVVYRDTDGDGFLDENDQDADNDGVTNNQDAFPFDNSETTDTDSDGVGDNQDAFPFDSSETKDTDNDGVGDNQDAFPSDSTETKDTDSDGVGDNQDAFPDNLAASVDADQDGLPDEWNASCDQVCQSNSGLILDTELPPGNGVGTSSSSGGGALDTSWLIIFSLLLFRQRLLAKYIKTLSK